MYDIRVCTELLQRVTNIVLPKPGDSRIEPFRIRSRRLQDLVNRQVNGVQ
jgi:hypothetical protein